ncbi:protein CutA homolog isoform X2 [Macrosteles quadrilineatus]|nr:protein CutA homolog isoform X2 [Macrosteles quadrilineatus]XP_054272461.1 protein CutA homolog isoform X2 [Macrosteles quadrilineatus]XP_054272462.1 protein CutA homolog isoform X2 [Macrosteles quadrilineatus]XP_054272463.1 protein CutA homolog isoform X2 [Macrosteles quadrilineatus]
MASNVFKPGLFSVVYITAPSQEVAKKIARGLVENQLAACVNIIPGITSIYKWEGKIEEDSELLLMAKTKTERIEELTSFVKANHPYSVPEVISTPIEKGHDLYLKFLHDNVPEKS